MRKLTAFPLVATLAIYSAFAQKTERVLMKESPNNKFSVDFVEDPSLGFAYQITRLSDERPLLKIPSSYQPIEASQSDWAKNLTMSATVFWNGNSSAVAISESTHQFMGAIFVAALEESKANLVHFPTEKLLEGTGERWNQVRIHVKSGWETNETLVLMIVGTCFADKISGNTLLQKTKTYDSKLRLELGLFPISLTAATE